VIRGFLSSHPAEAKRKASKSIQVEKKSSLQQITTFISSIIDQQKKDYCFFFFFFETRGKAPEGIGVGTRALQAPNGSGREATLCTDGTLLGYDEDAVSSDELGCN